MHEGRLRRALGAGVTVNNVKERAKNAFKPNSEMAGATPPNAPARRRGFDRTTCVVASTHAHEGQQHRRGRGSSTRQWWPIGVLTQR